jgi:hypothetical protein
VDFEAGGSASGLLPVSVLSQMKPDALSLGWPAMPGRCEPREIPPPWTIMPWVYQV